VCDCFCDSKETVGDPTVKYYSINSFSALTGMFDFDIGIEKVHLTVAYPPKIYN